MKYQIPVFIEGHALVEVEADSLRGAFRQLFLGEPADPLPDTLNVNTFEVDTDSLGLFFGLTNDERANVKAILADWD